MTVGNLSSSRLKNALKRVIRLVAFVGVDPNRILQWRHWPRYLRNRRKFLSMGGIITRHQPILSEFTAQAGSAKGHYFHQDLLVASFIHTAKPRRHIDIGSRIDGFVAHVASFRKIEVMDVRELEIKTHNISFIRADLMAENASNRGIADSVSCLHALEHFGLGRYGDPILPDGHLRGLANIIDILEAGGHLYVSFPIATSTSVSFNAHRIFHPRDILGWCAGKLELLRFDFVDDAGDLHIDHPLLDVVPVTSYGCGIYTFRKP